MGSLGVGVLPTSHFLHHPLPNSSATRTSCSPITSSSPFSSSPLAFSSPSFSGVNSARFRRRGGIQHKAVVGGAEGKGETEQEFVEDAKIPVTWSLPNKAVEESEWLRLALHKWLDDEYCPEPMNVEISKCAASSYHNSLIGKRTDLVEILVCMVTELEKLSYKESFHGAFSSANAAVHLIRQRIESLQHNHL